MENVMPRELTSHNVNGLNEAIKITVIDEPGQGGANHQYNLVMFAADAKPGDGPDDHLEIRFQNGPIGEVGVNGISNEALLAVLIDRMEGFQSGSYACAENGAALTNLRHALAMLLKRTKERVARGVEGTMKV
jgi:hypothetical protein